MLPTYRTLETIRVHRYTVEGFGSTFSLLLDVIDPTNWGPWQTYTVYGSPKLLPLGGYRSHALFSALP